jgi:hypothetical protein
MGLEIGSSQRQSQTLGKGKFVPVHTMKAYCWSGSLIPLIVNLGVAFSCHTHALPFYLRGKRLLYPLESKDVEAEQ